MTPYILTIILLTGTYHDTEAASVTTQAYDSKQACEVASRTFANSKVGMWRFLSFCSPR